jgi:hypothetical protein
MAIGDMLVGRKRMTDENGVGFARIKLAISLVGDLEGRQIHPAIEPQRILRTEAGEAARGVINLAQTKRGSERLGHHEQSSHLLARNTKRMNATPVPDNSFDIPNGAPCKQEWSLIPLSS